MNIATMFDLTGKAALVTGSSRGIGKAIAGALAAAGARVAIHASRKGGALDTTVGELRAAGATVSGVAADLGNIEDVEMLPRLLAETLGQIDILVLNASAQSYQTVDDFTPEAFELEYRVNVNASMLLIRNTVADMKKAGWGRILTIGSVNQWRPSPRLAVYASTKSALANIVLNCARQYAPYGITVNNLAPGIIMTDRNRDALADEAYAQLQRNNVPVGRFGTPDDCAALALLLCSNAGSYITGADIPVTGGMHL